MVNYYILIILTVRHTLFKLATKIGILGRPEMSRVHT